MFAGCMHLSVLSLGLVYRGLTVSFQLDFKHFCLIQVLQRVVIWRNYLFICTSLPETLLFKGDITIGSNVCKDSSLPPVIQCFPTWHLVWLQDSPEKKLSGMPPPPKKSIVFSFFAAGSQGWFRPDGLCLPRQKAVGGHKPEVILRNWDPPVSPHFCWSHMFPRTGASFKCQWGQFIL